MALLSFQPHEYAHPPWRYYSLKAGGGAMLRCSRPMVSLGIKSDLKTSTGHNCYRKWVAPSVQWLGKRRIGIRLLATTQCSSSQPSSNRLWDPHNTYPNDTEAPFWGTKPGLDASRSPPSSTEGQLQSGLELYLHKERQCSEWAVLLILCHPLTCHLIPVFEN